MIARILLVGIGLLLVVAGANLFDPYLFPIRRWAPVALPLGEAALLLWLARRRWAVPAAVWAAALAAVLVADAEFMLRKRAVLAENGAEAQLLGRHFLVGYTRVEDVAPLAAKGLIGGIFVTRRNSGTKLRRDIAELQDLRRANGLPPLVVAADQEGGIVSHLSPLLPAMPPLADIAALPAAERADAARRYGYVQGRGLASVGVSVNFSPVVDIKRDRLRWDVNSLIAKRAIAADPALVAEVAAAYAEGLRSAGVAPTLKHFPGLGRVQADTHHVRTRLGASVEELEATDWLPFRQVLAGGQAQVMVGHTVVEAVDPDRPASRSRKVVEGLIRQKWGFGGVVLTDDLTMPSVLHHGFCEAVTGALEAGVDLLLITYDGDQYYRAMECGLKALRDGRLEPAMLRRDGSAGRAVERAAAAVRG
ncbi:MAG: glycoside hydrolase family 3 N-terminal domain-containing protein [Bacteroidales bacterium]